MNILHNWYPNLMLPFASEIWTNLGKKKTSETTCYFPYVLVETEFDLYVQLERDTSMPLPNLNSSVNQVSLNW